MLQIGAEAETLGKKRGGGNGVLQIGAETLGKRRRSGGNGMLQTGAETLGKRRTSGKWMLRMIRAGKIAVNGLISGGSRRSNRNSKGLGKVGKPKGGEIALPRGDPPQALQATAPGHMMRNQRIMPQRHGVKKKDNIGKANQVFMDGSIWKGRVGKEDPQRQKRSGQTPAAKKGMQARAGEMTRKTPVQAIALAQAAAVEGLLKLKYLSGLASAAEGAATVVAVCPAVIMSLFHLYRKLMPKPKLKILSTRHPQ